MMEKKKLARMLAVRHYLLIPSRDTHYIRSGYDAKNYKFKAV